MIVHREGTLYELENFENRDNKGQMIQFIEKEFVPSGIENERPISVTKCDGTTTEEVMKVIINRLKILNEKSPCEENANSIRKMEEALFWQNKRSYRKLENKNKQKQ